ncbi:MAG TPA: hypothetical protein ENK57_12285 [Polyangiaceae bacterium]|nr:hypothetical protein [Polyangiaceae bacterium]
MSNAYQLNSLANKASGWASAATGREIEAVDVELRMQLGGDDLEFVASVAGFTTTATTAQGALVALLHETRRGVDLAAIVRRAVTQAPMARVRTLLAELLDGAPPEILDGQTLAELDDCDAVDMLYDLAFDETDPRSTASHARFILGES